MEDSESQLNSTPNLNASKAPQKVEVVVQSPNSQGEINITAELAIFILRIGFCLMMVHHGLEKFQDPEGFAEGTYCYDNPDDAECLAGEAPSPEF